MAVCLSYLHSCIMLRLDLLDQLDTIISNNIRLAVIKESLDEWTGKISLLLGFIKISLFQRPFLGNLGLHVRDFGFGFSLP